MGLTFPVNTIASSRELYVPRNIQEAYLKKTRSPDGRPGPKYCQNRADYIIHIHFDPATRILNGKETITYFNYSPDTLKELVIYLYPDYFKRGNARDDTIDYRDESAGVKLKQISINNFNLSICQASGKRSE